MINDDYIDTIELHLNRVRVMVWMREDCGEGQRARLFEYCYELERMIANYDHFTNYRRFKKTNGQTSFIELYHYTYSLKYSFAKTKIAAKFIGIPPSGLREVIKCGRTIRNYRVRVKDISMDEVCPVFESNV